VYVPFSDQDGATVYWSDSDIIRRSTNGGSSFTTVATPGIEASRCRLTGPLDFDDIVEIIGGVECWEYEDGIGLTHITPDLTAAVRDLLVMERDENGRATRILLVGSSDTNVGELQINEDEDETDVKGNWPTGNAMAIAKPELGEYASS